MGIQFLFIHLILFGVVQIVPKLISM